MNKRKTLIARIVLFTGTAISLFFVPWIIVYAWIMPLENSIQDELNRALELDFDGIVVYIDQAGKDKQYYAAGWHDRDKKIPANPHALIKMASVSKLYVAAAITKMAHDKTIDLDQTLAHYFPELIGKVEYSDRITIRMLVKHRSGLPNFTDLPAFWSTPLENKEGIYDLIAGIPAEFEPDAEYMYCNTNYFLLKELIEKSTGSRYFDFIEERITKPLGLSNTYGYLKDINMDSLMSGYYVGVEEDIKSSDYGSMIATAEDIGIFLRALNDSTLFEGQEAAMYADLYEFQHTGLIPGYQILAEYHQEEDLVIVQCVNTTDFEGYNWNLGEVVCGRVFKLATKE